MEELISQEGVITNPVGPEITPGEFGSGVSFFQQYVPRFIVLALIIGSLVFFFVMIIGAIQWITLGGDKTAVEAARGKITNAIVGILILFAVFVILRVIGDFFGIGILELELKPLFLTE